MNPIAANCYQSLNRYLIYGDPGNGNPKRWESLDDPTQAQYTAMTWLICGFNTKVIDLNLDGSMTLDTPSILYRFNNLQSVIDICPTISKFCMKRNPIELPYWPMDQSTFFAWLVDLSNGTPDL